jgi:hypothetical protein
MGKLEGFLLLISVFGSIIVGGALIYNLFNGGLDE